MTAPDIRLNACFLYSICPPRLRNELLNDRKATEGRGEEKIWCPCRQTRTKSSDFAREYLRGQTVLDFLEDDFSLNQYSDIYIHLSLSGFIVYRWGKKWEGREALPVILPKSFNYSENNFLLLKSKGEYFSLTKQHQLHVFFPVEDLQTNQSTKTLEIKEVPLIVSAVYECLMELLHKSLGEK